jgi:hypothetical protein
MKTKTVIWMMIAGVLLAASPSVKTDGNKGELG